jgi:undecaprenyl-diphosphatase
MEVTSALGDPLVVMAIAALVAIKAWRINEMHIFWLFSLTIIASICDAILKQFLHRRRPDTDYAAGMHIKSYSFPSGHAFGSVVTYGALAYIINQHISAAWNNLAVASVFVLVGLIGVSRVYLGAHYPTDVIAGWLLGAAVLGLIIYYL